MLTYKETVDLLADKMYHQWMGGASERRIKGCEIIAEIYEVAEMDLSDNVVQKFNKLILKRRNK